MRLRFAALLLAPALLVFSAQAGAAKMQPNKAQKSPHRIWTLALAGSRVAYASGGRIHVWNVATGATSTVTGSYGGSASNLVNNTAEVAIAGKRIAWIKDQQFGNTEEGEKLYTASVGGRAHQIDSVYRHDTDDSSLTNGGWIEGLAGSGGTLAVSTWKSAGTVATDQHLSLVTPSGLKPLAGGAGSIVSQSVDGSHIAVLRSRPWTVSTNVGIYSRNSSAQVGQVDLGPPSTDTVSTQVALSGNELVVLTAALREPSGPTTVTLRVYDWATGELIHTWPVGVHSDAGEVSLAVQGQLAAVEGPSRLHLVDLKTGKDVLIAPASHTDSPPAMDSRGLVYALNPHLNAPAKLVFVPTAKLLALVG